MSLFGRVVEARAIGFQEFFGRGGDTRLLGGESSALRLAAVFAATQHLANGLASLPLHEYAEDASGARTPVPPSPLITHPAAIGTPFDWKFQVTQSLAARGNAYGLPTGFDDLGRIVRCDWLHPDQVALDGEDDVLYWGGRRPRWLVDGRPFEELVHLRNYVLPGRIVGLSPIAAFRTVIETGLQAQQFGRDWFANGSVPAGVLETDQPIRQGDALSLKERFKMAARGRDVVALGRGAKYKPIGVAANESQFLETIQATSTTIAAIFNVSPEDIGGETGGSLTYNTDETRARRLVRVSLRPYMSRIEEALSALRPPGRVLRFNADDQLRAETLARYQSHEIAIRNGWQNVDETRQIENKPPLPNGAGQEYQKPQAAADTPPGPAQEGFPS